jgi:hypothetical protein
VVFILVNAGLFAINLLATPGRLWFGWGMAGWGMAGWGIGLAAHAISVFAFHGFLGREWEERRIRDYLDRGA